MIDREEAHQLVDEVFNAAEAGGMKPDNVSINLGKNEVAAPLPVSAVSVEPAKILPEGKRVVRTKASGDRVYFLDDVKKTRQWIANPDVLTQLGFEMSDVVEIDDTEMIKFQMGPALYRVSND